MIRRLVLGGCGFEPLPPRTLEACFSFTMSESRVTPYPYKDSSLSLQDDPHISMGDVARISPASPGKTSNLQSSVVAAEVPLSGGVSHAFTFERRS